VAYCICRFADDGSADVLADADRVLEEHAPGFGQQVTGRTVQRPSDLECSDANLHAGAVNGGTSGLFPQRLPTRAEIRPRRNPGGTPAPAQNYQPGITCSQ
jgi:phytoene dehydrogenase-like protein